jgi:hypothetical protein
MLTFSYGGMHLVPGLGSHGPDCVWGTVRAQSKISTATDEASQAALRSEAVNVLTMKLRLTINPTYLVRDEASLSQPVASSMGLTMTNTMLGVAPIPGMSAISPFGPAPGMPAAGIGSLGAGRGIPFGLGADDMDGSLGCMFTGSAPGSHLDMTHFADRYPSMLHGGAAFFQQPHAHSALNPSSMFRKMPNFGPGGDPMSMGMGGLMGYGPMSGLSPVDPMIQHQRMIMATQHHHYQQQQQQHQHQQQQQPGDKVKQPQKPPLQMHDQQQHMLDMQGHEDLVRTPQHMHMHAHRQACNLDDGAHMARRPDGSQLHDKMSAHDKDESDATCQAPRTSLGLGMDFAGHGRGAGGLETIAGSMGGRGHDMSGLGSGSTRGGNLGMGSVSRLSPVASQLQPGIKPSAQQPFNYGGQTNTNQIRSYPSSLQQGQEPRCKYCRVTCVHTYLPLPNMYDCGFAKCFQ